MIVPKEWEVVEIQKLVKITTGNKDTQDSNKYGLYPFFVRSQTIERINSYSFDGEAILTAGDGVGVGKVFHHVNGKFDFHQRVYCLSHFDQNVDPKFLFEYFKTNFIKQVNKYSAKGSVDSVRFDMIAKMLMPLPPKSEQQKIATILSTLDRTIEATQKLIDKEKMVKKGLMADLLTHGIDEQGRIRSPQTHTYVDSPLGMIPEGWDVKALAQCAEIMNSNIDKKSHPEEQAIRLCNYMDVYSNEEITNAIDFMQATATDSEIKRFLLKKNDVIITKDSESPDDIGIATYITQDFDDVLCGYHLTLLRPKKNCIGQYLSKALQSDNCVKYFGKVASGSTRYALSIGAIGNTKIIFPQMKEQEKIATILSAQDLKIETEETNLAKLQNLKKGLMGDLLSGDVRMKV